MRTVSESVDPFKNLVQTDAITRWLDTTADFDQQRFYRIVR